MQTSNMNLRTYNEKVDNVNVTIKLTNQRKRGKVSWGTLANSTHEIILRTAGPLAYK